MDRGSFACALLIGALGCAFDSTAEGDSASMLDTDTGESTTEVPPTGTSTAPATTDHATSASSTESGTSSGEPSTTTVADDAARLVIADHDFGVLGPGANDSAMLEVSNEGGVAANELAASGLEAPFGLAGGAWPGTEGTCADAIDPGKSCTIAIAFAPPAFGSWDRELVLAYTGGDEADARAMLRGASAGTTGNLIVNGDAESGGTPPSSWTNIVGMWTTRESPADAHAGSRSINGGPFPDVATAQLRQIVPLTGYDAVVDAGALTYAFAAFARSFGTNDDPYQIRFAFLDGLDAEVGFHDFGAQNESTYQSLADTNVVPAGTRSVAVDLFCHKQNGGNCSAFFDDLSLTVSYVAP